MNCSSTLTPRIGASLPTQSARYLKKWTKDEQQKVWDRWLQSYWGLRTLGFPVEVEGPEWEPMIRWLPYFKSLFPKAVECAIRMPNLPLEDDSVIYDFNELLPWSQYPEEAAQTLTYLNRSEAPLWFWDHGQDLIERLLTCDLPEEIDEELRVIQARFGH